MIALGLTLVLFIYLAVRGKEDGFTACMESLVLVPLYILFTSSLPWFFIHQDYLLPAVYSCIISLCLLHIYQKNINLWELINYPGTRKLMLYLAVGYRHDGIEPLPTHKPRPIQPGFMCKITA